MLNGKITIETAEYRPCFVGERRGLFHRWEENTRILLKQSTKSANYRYADLCIMREHGVIPSDCSSETIQQTFGIVEFEDGCVEEIEPSRIRFVPGLMTEYDFQGIEYRK